MKKQDNKNIKTIDNEKCQKCDYKTKSLEELCEHMQAVHEGSCLYCKKCYYICHNCCCYVQN